MTDGNDGARRESPGTATPQPEHKADTGSGAAEGSAAGSTATTSQTRSDTKADRSDKKADKKADKADKRAGRAERRRSGGEKVKAGADAVRARIASLVWLVAVLAALFLAVGALLVALEMNQHNAIVKLVLDVANSIDLGVFKNYTGKGAATKEALTDWGIAAVIYLVIGKVLDRLIRP